MGLVAVVGLVIALVTWGIGWFDRHGRSEAREGDWVLAERAGGRRLVVADGLVCSTVERDLFCVEAASGREAFSAQLPDLATSPTLVGEILVVGSEGGEAHGDLYGYSLQGELLWEAQQLRDVRNVAELDVVRRPLFPAAGNVVAVTTGSAGFGELVGIDARSGQEVWRALGLNDPVSSFSGPLGAVASDGIRFYVTAMMLASGESEPAPTLVALDAATGTERWRHGLDEPIDGVIAAAMVADRSAVSLAVATEPRRVLVLDAETGAHRWDTPVAGEHISVAQAETTTVVADAASVRGYDDNGTQRWGFGIPTGDDDPGLVVPDLVVGQGTLYAFSYGVFVIDPDDGTHQPLYPDVTAHDLAPVDNWLIIAGPSRLEGRRPAT